MNLKKIITMSIFLTLTMTFKGPKAHADSRFQQERMEADEENDARYRYFQSLKNVELSAYEGLNAKRILFLGDKESPINYSKSKKIHSQIPKVEVYLTDYDIEPSEEGVFENLIIRKVDHSLPLPFENNYFDLVLMYNGMCDCFHQTTTCGGIKLTDKTFMSFMNEVTRVLNKRNPHSFAILHGKNIQEKPITKRLVRSARKFSKAHPQLKVVTHVADFTGEKLKTEGIVHDLDLIHPEGTYQVNLGVIISPAAKIVAAAMSPGRRRP